MSDLNDKTDSPDTRPQGATLSLKRPGVEQSRVKQSFAHGRSKTVVVETRRKRFGDDKPHGTTAAPVLEEKPKFQSAPRVAAPLAAKPSVHVATAAPSRSGVVLRTLSPEEREARER